MIKIKGILETLTFQNPDNHYTVARLRVERLLDPITVVGHIGGVSEGETVHLTGRWGSHPKYGDQFNVHSFEIILPATIPGIRKYLGSGIIKGLGRGLADKIVDHFGDSTLAVIENEPGRLREVRGIGNAKQAQIESAWNTHHSVRRVMQFLQQFNISTYHASTILKNYGSDAMSVLEKDPYVIARDIPRHGFQIADTIAIQTGIPEDDPRRLEAYILSWLLQCEDEGHLFSSLDTIEAQCLKILGQEPEAIEQAIEELSLKDEIIVEPFTPADRVYLRHLFQAEKGISDRIHALLSMPEPGLPMEKDQIVELVLSNLAVKLSDEQLDVISQALHQRVVVITGGPGTGKTTLIQAVCAVFRRIDRRILLSAPTGRAARRLAEVTGKKAFTLHKLLGFDPETGYFERNRSNPLDMDVFIVDEASMVDTLLMYHLLQAVPVQSQLILVGDTFQLPSVGPGNVLADIIDSSTVKTFFLTKIFRQARQSPIVMNAHQIRNGEMPDLKAHESNELSDFYFIEKQSPAKVVEAILDLCCDRIRKAFPHIDEIQVLTPMHKGEAGTINLNQRLQEMINPAKGGLESNGMTFKPNDKVMHLKNNYDKEVFNGDIGVVDEVSKAQGKVWVNYDSRLVEYDIPELDELTLAYTISVHKSQGSEYAAVIVALTMNHFPLLQRNLLYTALTRGKSLMIIVGSKKAFETALSNNKTQLRRTGLKHKLEKALHYERETDLRAAGTQGQGT